MTPYWRAFAGLGLPWALAAALIVTLASCSSGSNVPSTAPSPTDAGPVVILPATANVFAEVPTTFTVVGGSGHYLLASSDANVIAVPQTFSGGSFSVVANSVTADTQVTLTVRDASGTSQASVQLTVKPRTVSNSISITPSAGQAASCGTAICSGGDAEVAATLRLAGAPLSGREVRFEALSGDFRFISTTAGGETLSTVASVTTDAAGNARIRIRALASAPSQTALLQVTDVASGSFQRASFAIAPASATLTTLTVQPATIAFTGTSANTCASGVTAEVIVTGGTPPYSISQPPGFTISTTTLASSGSKFVVGARGECSDGVQIAVVDAAGTARVVSVTNVQGPTSVSDLVVGPFALALGANCSSTASALIAGGVGRPYFATSSSDYLTVTVADNVLTVRRTNQTPPGAPAPSDTILIGVTDGRTVKQVSVSVPFPGGCT